MSNTATIRVPTQEEYLDYDGMHCRVKWRNTSDDWTCPGCDRTKFELLRWTKYKSTWALNVYGEEGWWTALSEHHDHGRAKALRYGPTPDTISFDPEIICHQCNMVDAAFKNKFKNVHRDWSFTPKEIRSLVTATPHASHKVDYEKALNLYHLIVHGITVPKG